jgi:hypothetical protein
MFQELSGRQNVIALDGKNNTQNEKKMQNSLQAKEHHSLCPMYQMLDGI